MARKKAAATTPPDEPAPEHTIGRPLVELDAAANVREKARQQELSEIRAAMESLTFDDIKAAADEIASRGARSVAPPADAQPGLPLADVLFRPDEPAPAADLPPAPARWHYTRCEILPRDFDAEAARLGLGGWELVAVLPDSRRERVGGELAEVKYLQTFWRRQRE